ncbi:hypothetical protein GCM10009109_28380 [Marinobacterium sediminicola]
MDRGNRGSLGRNNVTMSVFQWGDGAGSVTGCVTVRVGRNVYVAMRVTGRGLLEPPCGEVCDAVTVWWG